MNPDFADWVEAIQSSPTDAFCTVCKVVINLSNMGRSALVSHSKEAKHRKNVAAHKLSTQPSVMSYLHKSLASPAAANPDVSSTTNVSDQSLEAVRVPVPHDSI